MTREACRRVPDHMTNSFQLFLATELYDFVKLVFRYIDAIHLTRGDGMVNSWWKVSGASENIMCCFAHTVLVLDTNLKIRYKLTNSVRFIVTEQHRRAYFGRALFRSQGN